MQQKFFRSPKTARVSVEARYLLLGLMTEADDYGNVPLDPRLVRGSVLALDDLSIEAVENLVAELAREELVTPYEVDSENFGHIAGWSDKNSLTYQVIQHKSEAKNPTFNESSVSPHRPNQNQNSNPNQDSKKNPNPKKNRKPKVKAKKNSSPEEIKSQVEKERREEVSRLAKRVRAQLKHS